MCLHGLVLCVVKTEKYTTYSCSLHRACIDTSESGDLSSGPLLGEFSVTQEHTHLTELDQMTVSINVHNDGDTLEVVGMCCEYSHIFAKLSGSIVHCFFY